MQVRHLGPADGGQSLNRCSVSIGWAYPDAPTDAGNGEGQDRGQSLTVSHACRPCGRRSFWVSLHCFGSVSQGRGGGRSWHTFLCPLPTRRSRSTIQTQTARRRTWSSSAVNMTCNQVAVMSRAPVHPPILQLLPQMGHSLPKRNTVLPFACAALRPVAWGLSAKRRLTCRRNDITPARRIIHLRIQTHLGPAPGFWR